MKLWTQLLLLTVLDFVIVWFWVREQDPDPSVSIGIFLVVPLAIIVNLILAAILYFVKRKYTNVFLINSLIAAVIMYNLFIAGIDRHQRQRYESWQFNLNDTTFRITNNKLNKTFDISYSTNSGSSTTFIYGKVASKNSIYTLTKDSLRLLIKNNSLFGFRNLDSIKMKQIDL
ncbi:MAG: hypothetical protein V5804_15155 [Mucilaginibacter sp.]|uniref:hypothetical protein n=1 Tax=Mucilaginibacter sp. TaxID=1882438 RepID=UPI0034E5EBE1